MGGGVRRTGPIAPSPDTGEIHIWLTPPDTSGRARLLARGTDLLSGEERSRLEGFQAPQAAELFLLGRVLARRVLGHCLDLAPESVPILVNPQGKPGIAGQDGAGGLVFSLSHDGGTVALAVARGGALGVDLAALDRAQRVLRIAEKWFPEVERRDIAATPSPAVRAVAVWALKEALAKARGHSLFHELNRPLAEAGDGAADGPWTLMHGTHGGRFQLALAHRSGDSAARMPPIVACRIFNGLEDEPADAEIAVRWTSVFQ